MLNMFLRNCWYVAAWSHEIGTDLLSRKILGEAVCFYRTTNGEVAALSDRCPHRGAPLSRGRIEGDAVRCMYHGVKLGASGCCEEIPGQERIPPTMRVRSYPVVERNRWIWIWMGDPAAADPNDIPQTWSLGHPDWAYRPGYTSFASPHMLVCDNLMDFSHLAYVHQATLGGTEAIAQHRAKVETLPNGVHVERWLIDEVPAPFHTRVARFTGRVDRWHFYDFLVPGVLIMHSGVQATGTGGPEGNHAGALEFRSCQAVTPETTGSSHYFFAVPRNFETGDTSITETIFRDVVTAFNEDRAMIEAQAERLLETPDEPLVAIAADTGLAKFRWLMGKRLQAEHAPA